MVTVHAAVANVRTWGWRDWTMTIVFPLFLGIVFESVLVGLLVCAFLTVFVYARPDVLDDDDEYARRQAGIDTLEARIRKYAEISVQH